MLFQPGPQCEIGFLFFNAASGAVPGDSPRVATLTQCRLLGPRHREPTRVAPVEDSAGRFSLICAPSASRGRGVERAGHLLLDALHCAGADAQLAGNLEDALTGAQLSLDALFDSRADSPSGYRPTGKPWKTSFRSYGR